MLREAGVVDAGGYGLTVLFAGVIAALRGSEPPEVAHHRAARVTHPQHESSTYRYCVNFAVTGSDLRPRVFVEALERMGDSVLVVGDETTLKVHVHTDDPDAATALFGGAGTVSHLDVADMHQQVEARDAKLAAAVATGTGPAPASRPPAARSRSSLATASARSTRASASTRSTAARRSTPPRTTCSPASTPSRPRRSSCCRTARTSSWRPSAPPSCRRSACTSCVPARSRRGSRRRSRSIRRKMAPPTPLR